MHYFKLSKTCLCFFQVKCGAVYVTDEDKAKKVTKNVISLGQGSEETKRKSSSKYTLAIGSSFGHSEWHIKLLWIILNMAIYVDSMFCFTVHFWKLCKVCLLQSTLKFYVLFNSQLYNVMFGFTDHSEMLCSVLQSTQKFCV